MKKLSITFIVLMFVAFAVFAYQNTYNANSNEYKTLVSLYRIAGMTMHGVVTPLSSDDMLFLLKEIPDTKLDAQSKAVAKALREKLENPSFFFSSRGVLLDSQIATSPVGIVNTNKDVNIRELPFAFKDIEPLFLFEGTFYFGQHFTGSMGLDLIKSAGEWNFSTFATNFETELNGSKIDFYRPHKAYFAAGYDRVSFIIGRDRLSAGNGFTGNLTIGDNFYFQDFAKLSLLFPYFNYTLTISSFDSNEGTMEKAENSLDFSSWDDYHPEVLNHRLSINFFNKVTFTLTEGVMNYTNNAAGTVQMLNPFNILHNQFTFRNHRINNYFAVELDVAICSGLSTHFEFIGDQIQLPFENVDTTPNSYGLLLNFAYSFSIKESLVIVYLEGVYTSPSLYLKDDKTKDGGQIYGPEDVVAYDHRHTDLIFGNKMTGYDDFQYMGYKYGPDTIAVSTGFEMVNEKTTFTSYVLFMIQGENRINKETNDVPLAPVLGQEESKFIFTPYLTGDRVAQYSLICSANYETKLTKYLSVRAGIAMDNRWNYENIKGISYSNIEIIMSVKLDISKLVKPLEI